MLASSNTIALDFRQTTFIEQHTINLTLALMYRLYKLNRLGTTIWPDRSNPIIGHLNNIGFTRLPMNLRNASFGQQQTFQVYRHRNDRQLSDFLKDLWLGEKRWNASPALQTYIISKLLEIFLNGLEHSDSPLGIIVCAQFYPKLRELKLNVLDIGIGIPNNVRRYKMDESMTAEEALDWAFVSGNTTIKKGSLPRGIGLDLFSQLMRVNEGHLDLISNEGYLIFRGSEKSYSELKSGFQGTMFHLVIKCDDAYYKLQGEA